MEIVAILDDKKPKLSDFDIAQSVGVREETISNWRRGKGENIKMSNLRRLLELIEVDLALCLALPGQHAQNLAKEMLRRALEEPPPQPRRLGNPPSK